MAWCIEMAKAMNSAFEKLTAKRLRLEDELRCREQSQGKSHDVKKMTKLRKEIEAVDRCIERALNAAANNQ